VRAGARGARGAGGARGVLAIRNYRLFAGGQLISLTGTWMQLTAQDWLVLQLGGGGVELGAVLAAQFTPVLLLSLWAGVLADRYDKRRLLLLTQGAGAALSAVLAVLVATGTISLPLLLLLAALLGCAAALDTPIRQAFVVELVGPDLVSAGVALNSVTFNSARIIGPAVAGVLIASIGTAPVVAGNVASYLAVIAALVALRPQELRPVDRVRREPGQLRAGLAHVRHRPDLLLPIVLVGIVGTFGLNFPVTLPLLARQTFHGTAATYGLLTALVALGSVGGAVLATRRSSPTPRLVAGGALTFGVAEAAAGLMPNLLLTGILLVVTGATLLTMTTAANASIQIAAGDAMRGRVMALYILVFLGGTPVGAPLVGGLVHVAGPRAGLVAGGAACVVAALHVGWLLRRGQTVPLPATDGPQFSSQHPASSDALATSSTREAASRSASEAAEPRSPAASRPASLPTAQAGASLTGTARMPRASWRRT
jgi:MFS family permease